MNTQLLLKMQNILMNMMKNAFIHLETHDNLAVNYGHKIVKPESIDA